MSEQSKSADIESKDYLERCEKVYKAAYVISIGELLEAPFDRCLAEEMA